jgi:hypothetical protein
MDCYCYTVTVSPRIAREFQVYDYDRTNCVFFCGSKFTSKDSCLDFARDIERMKDDIREHNWTIFAGKSKRFPWMRL